MTTTARLRAFVALADHGSVAGVAAALVVIEPTVPAAVRALGEEVGVALLERRPRRSGSLVPPCSPPAAPPSGGV